jgi:hypothetical protein
MEAMDMMKLVGLVMLAVLCSWIWCGSANAQTADATFGCEANPTGDPIGGGEGYHDIKTTGDFIVKSKDEFLTALKEAQPGQVIFIPDGAEIDLTGEMGIALPGEVTLAGTRGLNGSLGARIFTTLRQSHTLFRTGGDEVRLTGLRFEGSFGGTEKVADHCGFLAIGHYGCEVDNCEIYNFNTSCISVGGAAINVRVHHNYIHHSQRSGYGYGVVVSVGSVHIIANKFDYCRHHVAAGGSPGCNYECGWCLIMPNCTSTCLDMHGGRDRGDNTDIAGDWMNIHHNTFQGPTRAVGIRGTPSQGAEIYNNWFFDEPKKTLYSVGNTRAYNNIYGPDKTPQEQPLEFVDAKPVEY